SRNGTMCGVANSRRPSRPARPARSAGRTHARHLYVVPDHALPDEAQPTDVQPVDVQPADVQPADVQPADVQPVDVQPELWDSQELRHLAQLRQLAIATGASKETIRLIESAATAEEALDRLNGAGLMPDEADSFEGMLAWFAPLLEPGCDQLDA